MDLQKTLKDSYQSLPQAVQDVFSDPENGTPSNISKTGCIKLAPLGHTAWNAWRTCFPTESYGPLGFNNFADFSDCDFNKIRTTNGFHINFSKFNFGDGADFSGTKIPRNMSFNDATFGTNTDFSRAKIDDRASFKHAIFDAHVNFEETQFGDWIDFDHAKFTDSTTFTRCQFGAAIRFNGARFGPNTLFDNSTFESGACFEYIKSENTEDRPWEPYEPTSNSFNSISFEDCTFKGSISFENREFRSTASFARSKFSEPPKFFGCKLHPDIAFEDATFPLPGSNKKANRTYRVLKQAFAQQQATREEQRFFRLEMAEEANNSTGHIKILFKIYEKTSDYGFSATAPLKYLAYTSIVFGAIYAALSWTTQCLTPNQHCSFNIEWLEFTLLQSIPLPGLDKFSEFTYKNIFNIQGPIGAIINLLIILHKIIASILIFLFSLASRNLFKMK